MGQIKAGVDNTLTATEISTGWTELRALKNIAMVWTRKALEDAAEVIPLPLRKLHSDNVFMAK
jgi:hypothetical protein